MEFRSSYPGDTKDYISNPGLPYIEEYEYKFDKEGHKNLVPKGTKIDVYSKIQADKDSCDINKLMERFALGDSEALNVNKGYWIDATKLPTNLAEVFERGLEAEQYFEGLPTDLKEMFDNSHSVFFTEMGSKSFDEKVNKYNDRFVNHQFENKEDPKNNSQEVLEYHE